jgi:nucleotide-binding universal stress UspA family protein
MTAPPLETGYAVAAVDGTEEGDAAVTLAAQEAARLGLELRLVHVMPPDVPLRPLLVPDSHGLGSFGSEALASASRLATDVAPDLKVTTHLTMGGRVSEVVDEAKDATFVVVGRRRATALDRAWSGGTLDGIASRATCPVVMVPSTRDRGDRPRRVVAGFKSSEHSAELFEAAFRAADDLRTTEGSAELEVVHAWKLSSGYDDMIARRVSEAATNREQKQSISDLIAPWQEGYPDVPVRVRVVHEYPVRALVEASREADRLIMVKPLHGSLVHHLGRTARGVLRFAECPVLVVPAKPRDQLTMPPLELEEEGELVP